MINQCDRLFDVGSMEAGTTPILVSLPSPASDVVFGTRWCWYPKLLPPPAGFQLTTCLPVTSMHITLHSWEKRTLRPLGRKFSLHSLNFGTRKYELGDQKWVTQTPFICTSLEPKVYRTPPPSLPMECYMNQDDRSPCLFPFHLWIVCPLHACIHYEAALFIIFHGGDGIFVVILEPSCAGICEL